MIMQTLGGERGVLWHLRKLRIGGFQSRDDRAMLVHKTIGNYGSCFAL